MRSGVNPRGPECDKQGVTPPGHANDVEMVGGFDFGTDGDGTDSRQLREGIVEAPSNPLATPNAVGQ
ncbi:MAG TPA: hypothetical protein VKE94_17200, partial [Gemmataceae bacterium]|nr:hypothetical protein [Gemmataceae bacterium]